MPAHTREIGRQCQRCGKRATVEVFNTYNASQGYYCAKHGDSEVARLNTPETPTTPSHRATHHPDNPSRVSPPWGTSGRAAPPVGPVEPGADT